jgi:hypothetical protein
MTPSINESVGRTFGTNQDQTSWRESSYLPRIDWTTTMAKSAPDPQNQMRASSQRASSSGIRFFSLAIAGSPLPPAVTDAHPFAGRGLHPSAAPR